MSQDGVGCKDCKRVREHVASLLPFTVLEALSSKRLHIRGVAMYSDMSRNHNIYTSKDCKPSQVNWLVHQSISSMLLFLTPSAMSLRAIGMYTPAL